MLCIFFALSGVMRATHPLALHPSLPIASCPLYYTSSSSPFLSKRAAHNFQPPCWKVWLNGRLFSHKLLTAVHIKVVLQLRNKFEVCSCCIVFLAKCKDIKRESEKQREWSRRQTQKVPGSQRMQKCTVNLIWHYSWLFLYKAHLSICKKK